jgi:hypothetical protein
MINKLPHYKTVVKVGKTTYQQVTTRLKKLEDEEMHSIEAMHSKAPDVDPSHLRLKYASRSIRVPLSYIDAHPQDTPARSVISILTTISVRQRPDLSEIFEDWLECWQDATQEQRDTIGKRLSA